MGGILWHLHGVNLVDLGLVDDGQEVTVHNGDGGGYREEGGDDNGRAEHDCCNDGLTRSVLCLKNMQHGGGIAAAAQQPTPPHAHTRRYCDCPCARKRHRRARLMMMRACGFRGSGADLAPKLAYKTSSNRFPVVKKAHTRNVCQKA